MEVWRTIPGFDRYDASTMGRIRTKPDAIDAIGRKRYAGRVMTPTVIRGGYLKVGLRPNAGSGLKNIIVHRAVMLAFIGPCPDGKQANHKNGDKKDNRLDNLEYVTAAENYHHALHTLGHRPPRGSNHWSRRLSDAQIAEIRRRAVGGETNVSLAAEFGCSIAAVSRYRHNVHHARRKFK